MPEVGEVFFISLLLVFWNMGSSNRINFRFVTQQVLVTVPIWVREYFPSNLPFMPVVSLAFTSLWNYWITELSVIWKTKKRNARQGYLSIFIVEKPEPYKTASTKRKMKNKNPNKWKNKPKKAHRVLFISSKSRHVKPMRGIVTWKEILFSLIIILAWFN